MCSTAAACFIEWPPASSCRISRCRGVIVLRFGVSSRRIDEIPGHARRDVRAPADDGSNRRHELGRSRVLQHEPRHAYSERLLRHIRILVHRQTHNPGSGELAFQLSRRVEAAHHGHHDVDHDDVRLQALGLRDECLSIADRSDDVAFGSE
jgi:hypothetical protein